MNDPAPAATRTPVPLALRWSVAATFLVLAVLVALRWLNQVSVFPPTSKDASLAPRLAPTYPDVREIHFNAQDGQPLYGWLQGRDDAPIKILQAMGNAEYVGPSAALYQETAAFLGAQFLLFDYRGYANSAGKPSEAGLAADMRGAYAYAVDTLKWRPSQVVVWGRSLGGGPATRLVADLLTDTPRPGLEHGGKPRALLLEAAFTSIPDMAIIAMPQLGVPQWLCYSLFDNLGRAPDLHLPVLHWQGDADDIIPFAQGQELFAALPGPKQFLRLQGTQHNNIWDDSARAQTIRETIARFLAQYPEKR